MEATAPASAPAAEKPDSPKKPASPSKLARSMTRDLSRRIRYGLDANSTDEIDKPKKKSSCILSCTLGVLTLGVVPLCKWMWDAEETYGPGDPRRILVNRHTERLKKAFLIFGALSAISEALMLSFTTPTFFYCLRKCPTSVVTSSGGYYYGDVSADAMLRQGSAGLQESACLPDPVARMTRLLAGNATSPPPTLPPPVSPPPVSPPPISPTAIDLFDGESTAMASLARGMLRMQLLTIRISMNATGPSPDEIQSDWTCLDGSMTLQESIRSQVIRSAPDASQADIDAQLNELNQDPEFSQVGGALSFINDMPFQMRHLFAGLMILTVGLWAVLRFSLFNVVKGRRLCSCRCCPKVSKCLQIGSKKILNALCPLALNIVMVLNNGLLLDNAMDWYNASLDLFDLVMLVSALIVIFLCLVLGIVALVLSIFPAICAGCAQLCGAKGVSATGIMSTVAFSIMTFSLYFFSILGVLTFGWQFIEGLLDNTFSDINWWTNFVARFVMITPNWQLVHPMFPGITVPIATFRIGKVGFIMTPIALDLLSVVVSFLGFLSCRGWDKKYGASVDDIEANLDEGCFEADKAEEEKMSLEKALENMDKAAKEYELMKEQLAEATKRYDQAKDKIDRLNRQLKRRKQGGANQSVVVDPREEKKTTADVAVESAAVTIDIASDTAAEAQDDDAPVPDAPAPAAEDAAAAPTSEAPVIIEAGAP